MSFLNRVQEFSENAFSLTDLSEADKMRILAGLDQRSGAIGNSGINGLGDSEEEREKKNRETSMRDFVADELDRIQQQLEDIDRQIALTEQDIARLNQEIADLRKEIRDLQLEDARLAAEQRRLEEEAQDIRDELDDLRPRVASAQKTTESAEAALLLAIENGAPPEEIERLTRIRDEALREQQDLEGQQAELEASLQDKLDAAKTIGERREIIGEALEEANTELEQKIAELEQRKGDLTALEQQRLEVLQQEQEAIQTMIAENDENLKVREEYGQFSTEDINQLSTANTTIRSALNHFNEVSSEPPNDNPPDPSDPAGPKQDNLEVAAKEEVSNIGVMNLNFGGISG